MIETIERKGNWSVTYSGIKFYPLDPRREDINLTDIAHALSLQCRFHGMTLRFYSVAQHSVLVSQVCAPEDALWGLLHDAAEAYICDLPKPLKMEPQMAAYSRIEANLLIEIITRFGLKWPMPASVKWADAALLYTEKRDLLRPGGPEWNGAWNKPEVRPLPEKIDPWTSARAKREFHQRFFDLVKAGNETIKQVARA